MSDLNIQLSNIRKSFEDNAVLTGIDLSIDSGEIIAIAGENGAGKSTLMKILSGALQADAGEIRIDGKPVVFHRPQDAMSYRIRMIYQELNLVRDLSVAENLFIVDESRKYGRIFTNKRAMIADAKRFLTEMGLAIDPKLPVARLNVAEQQMVEISKSLVQEVGLLIMDEPTAALNKEETDRLFEQMRHLKERGISIIYISHRLEEIFELADRIVILRDGQVVLEDAIANVRQEQLVTAMVGKQLENFYPKENNVDSSTVNFEVTGLTQAPYFRDVSFQVYKGEVLGIGGLMGSGKSEILRCLFGDAKPDAGQIFVKGKVVSPKSPGKAIQAGIVFLTADRKQEGLIMDLSISQNLTLSALKKFVNSLGFVNGRSERNSATDFHGQVKVKAPSLSTEVRHLSGGNQQKVVFGKWMMTAPSVFIMEEPTRGVDVGAKSEIYRLINQLTSEGISVIMVSSDIPELVAMSDRVLIFREGQVVQELLGDSITQHSVLHHSLRGSAS